MFAVAPSAGAWIEILLIEAKCQNLFVAPSAGAWIEIAINCIIDRLCGRRSLRGSVD